ncbi:ceramide-1-phosphate transfer protein isoform X1 [Podarcis muralis]|uniref:ceramide-1-phosphate transfer protein isoform X1 n=1 Tax=Podarcis muralis TaxID=64176 RepID=UPI0010A0BA91|nr:ceramide-1-phosphate transfer protein isoform X1 [Podarcis muralis]
MAGDWSRRGGRRRQVSRRRAFIGCAEVGKKEAVAKSFAMAYGDDGHNLREVLATFKSCLDEKSEILMDPYLAGWKGLVRFLNTMGTIFTFVSKDAVAKIQIMEEFRSGPHKESYRTLQSMVSYEMANNLVDMKKNTERPVSGCRTILRLHRALLWLQLFLEGLRTGGADCKTSVVCTDSYNASLANYHPWIIRKATTIAFCTLPNREAFFENMKVGSNEEAVEMLGEALPHIKKLYDITQELYSQHKLLDLP